MEYLRSYSHDIASFLVIMVVLGCAFFFLERAKPIHKGLKFFSKIRISEFFLALFNISITQPILTIFATLLTAYLLERYVPHQIFNAQILALPYILQILCALLVQDFSVYWRHRFTHFSMWSYHSVHHGAQELTWTTKFRLHPVDLLAAVIFDTVILYILGFSGAAIVGAGIAHMFIDVFAHTNINVKFPKPLRYILASPHSHRWHHANVKEAYDKNFCSVFPFYDIMFGTFYHPEDLPPQYGLSKFEQKNYPTENFIGWLTYPFQREYKRLRKYFKKS